LSHSNKLSQEISDYCEDYYVDVFKNDYSLTNFAINDAEDSHFE